MIITFILPSEGNIPIGGFKIVYEYANRLCAKGYIINLVHPRKKKSKLSPLSSLRNIPGFLKVKLLKRYGPEKWFKLDKRINVFWIPYLNEKYIPNGDIIVATEWTTANPVNEFSDSKGKKLYFIQSLETWNGPEREVIDTWKLPLEKIVISKWLRDFGNKLNVKTNYIPNGFDFEKFGMDLKPEDRNSLNILMLYNNNPVKGSSYGLEILKIVKNEIPNLNVNLFGVMNPELKENEWFTFHKLPDPLFLRKLYNQASIFVSPSLMEGFPLPPAEAMICGAAVVATNIGGHNEYCIDKVNSLLSIPKDLETMANNIISLIRDPKSRIILSYRGNSDIHKYSWDSSVQKFEKVILSLF